MIFRCARASPTKSSSGSKDHAGALASSRMKVTPPATAVLIRAVTGDERLAPAQRQLACRAGAPARPPHARPRHLRPPTPRAEPRCLRARPVAIPRPPHGANLDVDHARAVVPPAHRRLTPSRTAA